MSRLPPGLEPASRRPAGRRTAVYAAALCVAGVLVFVVGLAVGRASSDGPPEGTQTLVRTLRVLTVEPARETVTVTVTN